MRVRLLLAIATLDCAVSFAQLPDSVWSRAYGGEWHQRAVRIAATPDGGIAIAGNDEHGGDFSDFFLMRFAANGDSLWARTYGADSIDVLTDFLVTTAGEFVLAGYSLQLFDGFYHVDVIKASVDGNVVWEYPQFPVDLDHDEFCFGISSHPSGGYVGTWDVTLGSLRRAGLFGLTDEGQSNWSSSTTWNSDQRFHDLTVRWNGSEYAAGFVANGPAGGDDALLVYHHIDHTEWWSRRYGGPSRDRCLKIIETSDGGYLLGGTTLSFGAGDQDIWLLKINAQGDSLWSQTFGGAYFDDFGGVIETANGGFLIVGTHEDAADGNFNLLLGWCNATGGDRQQRFIGAAQNDEGADIVAVNDHEFAIAGTTRSYGGDGRQFWLLKYAYLPHIGTDRASLNFSGVHIGDSATRTLNIINTGAVDLTVTGIITPPEFSFAGQFPVVLEPSDSVAVDIIFAPTTVGPHIDTLFVESYAVTGPHPVRLLGTGIATDAQDNAHLLPEALALAPAFPNPFNASTTLRFALPEMTDIKLTALNLTGQEVAMLAEGAYAGSHSVQWNAAGVPSGVYFVRLQTPRETLTQKILLLK